MLVSNPYAASRSSIACKRPKSPERPPPLVVLAFERDSKMSRVLARRRENWRGVRSGVLVGAEGKMEMWRGLFCVVIVRLRMGSCRVDLHSCLSRLDRLLKVLLSCCEFIV